MDLARQKYWTTSMQPCNLISSPFSHVFSSPSILTPPPLFPCALPDKQLTPNYFSLHLFPFCYSHTQICYFWYHYLCNPRLIYYYWYGYLPWLCKTPKVPSVPLQLVVKFGCRSHNSTCGIWPFLMVLPVTFISFSLCYMVCSPISHVMSTVLHNLFS